MYLLVISDTHGHTTEIVNLLLKNREIEKVVHLGDMVRDAEDLSHAFPKIPFIMLAGNNDFFSQKREERYFDWHGIRIFAAHGHTCNVRSSTDGLTSRAKEGNAKIALFGHTHVRFEGEKDGITILNPSSTGYYLIDEKGNYTYNNLY